MSAADAERTAREREVLDNAAQLLIERRLTAPAILFLESIKPLSFITSQALVFLGPLVQALLSFADYQVFAEAVESRENLEWLIQRLEAADKTGPPPPKT
jgi:hypothetical protein